MRECIGPVLDQFHWRQGDVGGKLQWNCNQKHTCYLHKMWLYISVTSGYICSSLGGLILCQLVDHIPPGNWSLWKLRFHWLKFLRMHRIAVIRDTYNRARAVSGHYDDVVLGAMASQITSLTIVYSIVYSGTDQRKHQSSASLAFVRGIHRRPVNSPHKGPVTLKIFPFDDVIMGGVTEAPFFNLIQPNV